MLFRSGVDVYNFGMVPTPVMFREAKKYGAGLIITSSHNPLEWNGLKFIINGRGPNEKEFAHILKEKQMQQTEFGTESKVESKYIDEAARIIGKIKHRPRIIVDVGGGAASLVAPQLLRKLGCQVDIINEKSTKRGPDPTVDKLTQLVSRKIGRAHV